MLNYNVLTNQIGVYICDFYRHVFCFVFPEIVLTVFGSNTITDKIG